MRAEAQKDTEGRVRALTAAEEQFRDALVRAHRAHRMLADLEAAAGLFSRAIRAVVHTPEGMLIEAKRIICDVLDDDDRWLSERVVSTCIRQYYRA